MTLLLTVALAQDYTPPTESEVQALLIESRELTACREREAGHLDALDDSTAGALRLRALLTQCTTEAREVDAELVARVDALTEALARSERRRGRLRTAGAVVLGVVVGAVVWEGAR